MTLIVLHRKGDVIFWIFRIRISRLAKFKGKNSKELILVSLGWLLWNLHGYLAIMEVRSRSE